jgi:hypothetical protein
MLWKKRRKSCWRMILDCMSWFELKPGIDFFEEELADRIQ